MNRRALLAALATGTAAVAGCASRQPNDAAGTDGTTTDDTTTDDAATTDDKTPSRFLEDSCPSFREGVDSTRCYHDGDAVAYTVTMTPSQEVLDATSDTEEIETITFELANDSGRAVGFNPHAWRIDRRTDDGWEFVAPEAYPEPWFSLSPGQSYEWVLSLRSQSSTDAERTMQVVEDLGDGVYAFSVAGQLGGETTTPDGTATGGTSTWIEWVVLFEVQRASTSAGTMTTTGTEAETTTDGS